MAAGGSYRRLLEGVLRFHEGVAPPLNKGRMVPKHVVINCVDPRVAPSR